MQRWEDAQAAVHLVARASLGDPITRVAAYQNLLAIGTAFGSVRDASISFRATSWYIRGNCLQVSLWDMRTHSGPPVLSACADTRLRSHPYAPEHARSESVSRAYSVPIAESSGAALDCKRGTLPEPCGVKVPTETGSLPKPHPPSPHPPLGLCCSLPAFAPSSQFPPLACSPPPPLPLRGNVCCDHGGSWLSCASGALRR
jgi:hypothetical protein